MLSRLSRNLILRSGKALSIFLKADAICLGELFEWGGYSPARDRGKLRSEGRDYVVADGDVITIKV